MSSIIKINMVLCIIRDHLATLTYYMVTMFQLYMSDFYEKKLALFSVCRSMAENIR